MSVLEVVNLHVAMGGQEILRGVSIHVGANEIVAVLGSNGVGKTTLMRAISGVYPVRSGAVRFVNEDIAGRRAHEIVARGLLQAPEGRQIFSNMSVKENLALGGRDRGLEALDEVLGLFPALGERLGQRGGSLSGGEQQMLAISRALMARPKLLLLDEPSLGLAPMLVRRIFALVSEIRARGVPILLVEQNARAALEIADRAYVMEGGRVAIEGPARELAADPRILEAYLGGHVL